MRDIEDGGHIPAAQYSRVAANRAVTRICGPGRIHPHWERAAYRRRTCGDKHAIDEITPPNASTRILSIFILPDVIAGGHCFGVFHEPPLRSIQKQRGEERDE